MFGICDLCVLMIGVSSKSCSKSGDIPPNLFGAITMSASNLSKSHLRQPLSKSVCIAGGLVSYFKGFFGQKEIRILILGLDGKEDGFLTLLE